MWVLWSDPGVPLTTVPALTPIPRAVASLAAFSVFGAPVLLRAAAAGAAEPMLDVAPRNAWRTLVSARASLETASAVRVVGGFIGAQWIATLLLARSVRHAGWIYYQGGDQLWYYTLGWLLGHGQITQTPVGYGWSTLLSPIARIAGPNLASALPAIVLLNVLVLTPIAMAALYGIAARIGGRLFGYWALLLWVLVPFVGILYTDAGYHQRYTELTLPQAFGLTAMSDFPTMVATIVSLYFCARVVFDATPRLVDAVAGGVAAGIALGIKPATVLFLGGPALAFVVRRRPREAAAFAAAMVPALVTLALWKERGLGYLPLLGAVGVRHIAGTAALSPVFALDLQHYTNQLNWSKLSNNIDLLREHFWSGRFLVWIFFAGLLGLWRRTHVGFALIAGSIIPFALVKGSYASVEDASVWRILMPCWPMFILALACLPLLLPHAPGRLRNWEPAFAEWEPRRRLAVLGAAVAITAVFPFVAIAAAGTRGLPVARVQKTEMPVPAAVGLGVKASVAGNRVTLHWNARHAAGGPLFYVVMRSPAGSTTCTTQGVRLCAVQGDKRGATSQTSFTDRAPGGRWTYRVMIAANWLNDPNFGDVYAIGRPVSVRVR